ncbi:MAG: helix-turn-helix domain-containing protein [Clostridia bacterium]|nr:helix-turn-helix domain-containing protein [Clostridia bacterium]
MQNTVHHQSQNTGKVLITAYRYNHTSNPGPIGISHFHKNYEILIPTLGKTRVTVDGCEYTIRPGEAIMIHPFQTHCMQLAQSSWIWCSAFSAGLVGGLAALLEGKRPQNPVFHPSEGCTRFFLEEMMRHFGSWGERNTLTEAQRLAAKACLYAIGGEYVAEATFVQDRLDERNENLAADIALYVADHFKNDITLQDVAKELGYHYQYLSKAFQSLFGMHFKQLLNQYRMEHAIRLLQETALPITRIAFESGFQSLRSFNHVCKEMLGTSPTEIRGSTKS